MEGRPAFMFHWSAITDWTLPREVLEAVHPFDRTVVCPHLLTDDQLEAFIEALPFHPILENELLRRPKLRRIRQLRFFLEIEPDNMEYYVAYLNGTRRREDNVVKESSRRLEALLERPDFLARLDRVNRQYAEQNTIGSRRSFSFTKRLRGGQMFGLRRRSSDNKAAERRGSPASQTTPSTATLQSRTASGTSQPASLFRDGFLPGMNGTSPGGAQRLSPWVACWITTPQCPTDRPENHFHQPRGPPEVGSAQRSLSDGFSEFGVRPNRDQYPHFRVSFEEVHPSHPPVENTPPRQPRTFYPLSSSSDQEPINSNTCTVTRPSFRRAIASSERGISRSGRSSQQPSILLRQKTRDRVNDALPRSASIARHVESLSHFSLLNDDSASSHESATVTVNEQSDGTRAEVSESPALFSPFDYVSPFHPQVDTPPSISSTDFSRTSSSDFTEFSTPATDFLDFRLLPFFSQGNRTTRLALVRQPAWYRPAGSPTVLGASSYPPPPADDCPSYQRGTSHPVLPSTTSLQARQNVQPTRPTPRRQREVYRPARAITIPEPSSYLPPPPDDCPLEQRGTPHLVRPSSHAQRSVRTQGPVEPWKLAKVIAFGKRAVSQSANGNPRLPRRQRANAVHRDPRIEEVKTPDTRYQQVQSYQPFGKPMEAQHQTEESTTPNAEHSLPNLSEFGLLSIRPAPPPPEDIFGVRPSTPFPGSPEHDTYVNTGAAEAWAAPAEEDVWASQRPPSPSDTEILDRLRSSLDSVTRRANVERYLSTMGIDCPSSTSPPLASFPSLRRHLDDVQGDVLMEDAEDSTIQDTKIDTQQTQSESGQHPSLEVEIETQNHAMDPNSGRRLSFQGLQQAQAELPPRYSPPPQAASPVSFAPPALASVNREGTTSENGTQQHEEFNLSTPLEHLVPPILDRHTQAWDLSTPLTPPHPRPPVSSLSQPLAKVENVNSRRSAPSVRRLDSMPGWLFRPPPKSGAFEVRPVVNRDEDDVSSTSSRTLENEVVVEMVEDRGAKASPPTTVERQSEDGFGGEERPSDESYEMPTSQDIERMNSNDEGGNQSQLPRTSSRLPIIDHIENVETIDTTSLPPSSYGNNDLYTGRVEIEETNTTRAFTALRHEDYPFPVMQPPRPPLVRRNASSDVRANAFTSSNEAVVPRRPLSAPTVQSVPEIQEHSQPPTADPPSYRASSAPTQPMHLVPVDHAQHIGHHIWTGVGIVPQSTSLNERRDPFDLAVGEMEEGHLDDDDEWVRASLTRDRARRDDDAWDMQRGRTPDRVRMGNNMVGFGDRIRGGSGSEGEANLDKVVVLLIYQQKAWIKDELKIVLGIGRGWSRVTEIFAFFVTISDIAYILHY
ncbi:uncharacterized protein PAC_02674 [Phialocephala subalpina]|uniref:Uncharacterized protein n=1 Tax=Phialocephala subalpina TaxID=576137 RepID=A0A1L7WJ55_9HELO|nr:uncharacterized protein PAC_02674 [Phialocephala subalpina]